MTKRDQMTADYRAGMTAQEIADKYGYSCRVAVAVAFSRWRVKLPEEERESRKKEGAERGLAIAAQNRLAC